MNGTCEIDESCFFRRKNNEGRVTKQLWAVGVFERDTRRLIGKIVKDRTARTLTSFTKNNVQANCVMICSDEWRGYGRLRDLGYNH